MDERESNVNRFTSFVERITTFKCMKIFVIIGIGIKTLFILVNIGILLYKRNEKCRVPLKLFISVYTLLLFLQAILFFLKHKDFFSMDRMPDFSDNNELSLFSNLVDAFTLFWYLTGLHWTQECTTCKLTNTLLYYTTIFIVIFGLVKIVLPLIALVLLVLIISYLNPKIPVVEYDKNKIKEEDARCSICLEKYVDHVQLKYLPCGHHFHSNCIDGWFSVEELCPLCMKPLNLFHEMIEQPPI
ncbi:E3 ubiquitin ligase [Tubulinosema ratisbonensis]|uniref:E3 ubiquitin ligase n=1 Tax=Tubulinosema ratisbonensis TaxID=291195 RepID=A0A437APB7_9MICR|nr:E3 ubiquitin ligase [Tubulinosema ratisbonensis]